MDTHIEDVIKEGSSPEVRVRGRRTTAPLTEDELRARKVQQRLDDALRRRQTEAPCTGESTD